MKEIFCKMCNKITKHFDIENILGHIIWKCVKCGEYNQPENK